MARQWRYLLICQWWLSTVQLAVGCYIIGYWAWRVNYAQHGWSWDYGVDQIAGIAGWLAPAVTQTPLQTFRALFLDSSNTRASAVLLASTMLVAGVCSLCLLSIYLFLVFVLRRDSSAHNVWINNSKDAMMGIVPSALLSPPTILGRPRIMAVPVPFPRFFKRFLATALFRRVRPVETRMYALAGNLFAIVSIAVLMFRLITALQKAQDQIQTHLPIGATVYDPRWDTTRIYDITLNISLTWTVPNGLEGSTSQFQIGAGNQKQFKIGSFNYSFALFPPTILQEMTSHVPPYIGDTSLGMLTYRIEAQLAEAATNGTVHENQMPRIWLVNLPDLDMRRGLEPSDLLLEAMSVRKYLPPLNLLSGSHITGETSLITRRFIISSILKDWVLNSDPSYRTLSLYPTAHSSLTALNSSDTNLATANIRATLNPGLMYHRAQIPVQNIASSDTCDYITDYRASTILDVIGSVGGLFALLQAVHVLLFGRPLLWGLTGAKTITPFGLLGRCSSRSFRRRLREEYYGQSDEESTDTIQIGKLLRDFVIELGPADIDPKSGTLQQSETSSPKMGEPTNVSVTKPSRAPPIRYYINSEK
ncbi:transmembrane protein [Rhizoctonia solani]|uniref:Transmembrane protein n=1 Tax=Rhizoctonia solani TaxID=456999 RepID=A0A8H8P6I4_9AGAM|nr:uncharacterized protein RhiXN_11137 [Rhizoctonia solani]QRW26060.1 transmembrane protein [Rhizoctonia solani]